MTGLRGGVDAGAAALVVTHAAQHAAWADRIVHLRDGAVVDESILHRDVPTFERAG